MEKLVITGGPLAGQEFVLGTHNTIGSALENTICLKHISVATQHAVLHARDAAFYLIRKHDRAILAVNGKTVADEARLNHGDILQIGKITAVFMHVEPEDPNDVLGGHAAESGFLQAATPQARARGFRDTQEVMQAFQKNERLRKHLESLYQMTSLISSTLDPRELTTRVLESIFRIFSPDRIFLLRFDEAGKLKVTAQSIAERYRAQGFTNVSRSILREVLHQREAMLVKAAAKDPRFSLRDSVVEQHIHSVLCAPLMKRDQVTGMLYLDRLSAGQVWEEDDLNLLNAIACQLSIGLENARMYERTIDFSRKLALLSQGARAVSATLERDRIVQRAVETAARTFDCTRCSILLFNPQERVLEMAFSTEVRRDLWPQIKIKPGEGLCGQVFAENKPMLVTDAAKVIGPPRPGYESNSFLIVPIGVREGDQEDSSPIGVITLTGRANKQPLEMSDQELLNIFAMHVGTSLHSATLEVGRKLSQYELKIAGQIQQRLLPKRLPRLRGYDLHAVYLPRGLVGGDYYDFIQVDNHRIGIVVADVSGEGVPGSLLMTELRATLRAEAPRFESPRELMVRLNRILYEDVPRGMFVTTLYGVLDVASHRARFSSCGHPPAILWHARLKSPEVLHFSGLALGLDEGSRFEASLQEQELSLEPGDRLILYTDGLVEAMDSREQHFEEHFRKLIPSIADRSSEEFTRAVIDDLKQFQGSREQQDDLTLVTLRRTPVPPV